MLRLYTPTCLLDHGTQRHVQTGVSVESLLSTCHLHYHYNWILKFLFSGP